MTGIPLAEGSNSNRWYDGGEAQRECAPHFDRPYTRSRSPAPTLLLSPTLTLTPTPTPTPTLAAPRPRAGTSYTSTRRRRCGPSRPLCTGACRSCSSGCSASSTRRKPKERHCELSLSLSRRPLTARETPPQAPSLTHPLHPAPAPPATPAAPPRLPPYASGRPVEWRGRPSLAVCPHPGCLRMRTGAMKRVRLSATLRRPTLCQRSSPPNPNPRKRGHRSRVPRRRAPLFLRTAEPRWRRDRTHVTLRGSGGHTHASFGVCSLLNKPTVPKNGAHRHTTRGGSGKKNSSEKHSFFVCVVWSVRKSAFLPA